jgi:hypothetical protein
MSRTDYEAIANIIEDVVGKNTLACVKLLEGIKFYLDNKVEQIKVVNDDYVFNTTPKFTEGSLFSKESGAAMKKYTAKLNKETEALKKSDKYCGIKG